MNNIIVTRKFVEGMMGYVWIYQPQSSILEQISHNYFSEQPYICKVQIQ